MARNENNPMVTGGWLWRPTVALSRWCFRHPFPTLAAALLVLAAALQVTAASLTLRMDWTVLFGEDEPVVKRVAEAREELPLPGDIAVLADGGTEEQRRDYMDRLAAHLAREPDRFRLVFYRVDLDLLREAALFYLSEDQLRTLVRRARGLEPVLGALKQADSLPELVDLLDRSLPRGGGGDSDAMHLLDRALEELETSLVTRGGTPPKPLWEDLLPAEGLGELHISARELLGRGGSLYTTLDQGRIHVLTLKTGTPGQGQAIDGAAIERLREILDELRPSAYPLRVRLTGLPVLLYDERQTATDDSLRSTVLCLFLVTVVLVVGFGEWRRPMLAVFALVVGLGWTMGFTTLAVGHLNFITVTYLTILLGLGIDFGIHLLFRYSEEKEAGRSPEESLVRTMESTGVDVVVGAFATSLAFAVMALVGFKGVAELGVIGAGGVLLCLLSTLTVLPAGLALEDTGPGIPPGRGLARLGAHVEGFLLARPGQVLLVGALFSLGMLAAATRVDFDHNLLNMQAPELESIRTERQMIQETDTTVLTAAVLARDMEEARELGRRFRALPEVAGVRSPAEYLPSGGPRKTALVARLRQALRDLDSEKLESLGRGGDPADLEEMFRSLGSTLDEMPDPAGHDLEDLRRRLDSIRNLWETLGPGALTAGFGSFRDSLVADVDGLATFLRRHRTVAPTEADLPKALRARMVGRTGRVQVSIVPRDNLWEREPREKFLRSLEAVDPDLLGHPVVMDYIGRRVQEAHQELGWASLAAVALVMLLYLRSPRTVFLALAPTALSLVWMMGAMGLGGIPFNSANFVALPMLVGLAAVFGIHVLHRMGEEGDETILSCSTGPALLLSGLTTMVGFGSLMVAHHRGIASLGFVISVGVGASIVVSLVLLPAAVRWLRLNREGQQ